MSVQALESLVGKKIILEDGTLTVITKANARGYRVEGRGAQVAARTVTKKGRMLYQIPAEYKPGAKQYEDQDKGYAVLTDKDLKRALTTVLVEDGAKPARKPKPEASGGVSRKRKPKAEPKAAPEPKAEKPKAKKPLVRFNESLLKQMRKALVANMETWLGQYDHPTKVVCHIEGSEMPSAEDNYIMANVNLAVYSELREGEIPSFISKEAREDLMDNKKALTALANEFPEISIGSTLLHESTADDVMFVGLNVIDRKLHIIVWDGGIKPEAILLNGAGDIYSVVDPVELTDEEFDVDDEPEVEGDFIDDSELNGEDTDEQDDDDDLFADEDDEDSDVVASIDLETADHAQLMAAAHANEVEVPKMFKSEARVELLREFLIEALADQIVETPDGLNEEDDAEFEETEEQEPADEMDDSFDEEEDIAFGEEDDSDVEGQEEDDLFDDDAEGQEDDDDAEGQEEEDDLFDDDEEQESDEEQDEDDDDLFADEDEDTDQVENEDAETIQSALTAFEDNDDVDALLAALNEGVTVEGLREYILDQYSLSARHAKMINQFNSVDALGGMLLDYV